MKKYFYSLALIAFAIALVLPVVAKAEEATGSPTPVPANIREKLRLELELKNQNLKANQGFRNDMLEKKKMASSTASTSDKMLRRDLKEVKEDIKDVRKDFRDDVKDIRKDAKDEAKDFIKENRNGSTTLNKKEVRREIEFRLFQIHKDNLVRQLNLGLSNLKQIRERIVARITKAEQTGRNMSEAKALLVTADLKITAAQVAITDLTNLSVGATSTATTTVKLDKPREVGDKAIKALKAAREALQKVVVSIAHNMGRGNGQATTTPPVATTTPPVATTTPPVTATTTATTTTP